MSELSEKEQNLPDEEDEGTEVPVIKLTEKDRVLYDRISHEIISRKLYLRPGFNKSELIKEIHIPDYKFAALFKTFAGCGFSQYLRDCRMDYAIGLMRKHRSGAWKLLPRKHKCQKLPFTDNSKRNTA